MSFGVMSSNALTAKRFERKVKEPLKAEDVLSAKGTCSKPLRQAQDKPRVVSAKQRIARSLAPSREARSGTSRRNR